MSSKRIAIIGAGPSGLTAIKQCLEYGHTVTCFEKIGDIGGLWRYHDEDVSGIPSVAKNTIINTSKEISAFSDFPPPNKFPNYMPHFLMLKYLEMYVEHFKLRSHVKLNHEVLWIRKTDDHSRTGRWVVKFKYDGNVIEETFDGVMICNGHHVYPRMAHFPGQEKFRGEIMHTHSYKKPDRYVDKKVVIVGFGNSALDAAVEIARVAKQVYLSTRRGSWVVSRNFIKGLPLDYWLSCRIVQTFAKTFGKTWSILMESLLNFYLDHEKYGIKPKHRYCNQHPSICDELAHWVISGRVLIRKNIQEFTENGVKFEDSDETVEIDSVVMGTGYDVGCPFLDSSVLDVADNRVELYKNVFNPKLDHPHTLAFIGLVQPLGAVFPVSEIQSRWFAALMKGEISLPSKSHMLQDIDRVDKERWSRFYQSPRNAIEVDHMLFMDSIAEQIGCKPNLVLLALKDPKLWYHLIFGPGVSYQYRLVGPHSWPGARDAIINVDERLIEALKPSKIPSITNEKSKEHKEYSNGMNGINGSNGTTGYHNGLNGHHYHEPEE